MKTLVFAFVFAIGVIFLLPQSVAAADYTTACKACHAVDGKGNPGIAKMKKIDLAKLDLTKVSVQKASDADLAKVIREGKDTMKGIPADKLSDADLKVVISHMRTLK